MQGRYNNCTSSFYPLSYFCSVWKYVTCSFYWDLCMSMFPLFFVYETILQNLPSDVDLCTWKEA